MMSNTSPDAAGRSSPSMMFARTCLSAMAVPFSLRGSKVPSSPRMFRVAMAAGTGHRARSIEGWVLVKEAERLEPERDDVDWHDRPVLNPRDVVNAEDVPKHHVGSHQRRVIGDPASDPRVLTRLCRIVTGRPAL